jgi:hypothetical protein
MVTPFLCSSGSSRTGGDASSIISESLPDGASMAPLASPIRKHHVWIDCVLQTSNISNGAYHVFIYITSCHK